MDIVIEDSEFRLRNKDELKVMKLVNQFEPRRVVENITKIEKSAEETGNQPAETTEVTPTHDTADTFRTNQAKEVSIEYRQSPNKSIPRLSEELPRGNAPAEWSISRLRKPNEVCMCRPGMTCEFCADRLSKQ